MKRLKETEVENLAICLSMSKEEAQDVADVFVKIYTEEQGGKGGWKIRRKLDCVGDYIDEWEEHWHREQNFEEYYECEKEYYAGDYEDVSVFDSIEKFREYAKGICYQLEHSEMVIVVC